MLKYSWSIFNKVNGNIFTMLQNCTCFIWRLLQIKHNAITHWPPLYFSVVSRYGKLLLDIIYGIQIELYQQKWEIKHWSKQDDSPLTSEDMGKKWFLVAPNGRCMLTGTWCISDIQNPYYWYCGCKCIGKQESTVIITKQYSCDFLTSNKGHRFKECHQPEGIKQQILLLVLLKIKSGSNT